MMIKVNVNLTLFALAFIPASGLLISHHWKIIKKTVRPGSERTGEFLSGRRNFKWVKYY